MKELIVVLHDIRSLHNVGSIFRTADGAGVRKLYLCGITGAPVDRFGNPRPQVAKVALGAEKTVAWEKREDARSVIKELKGEDYQIIALEQSQKSIPYYQLLTARRKLALVLGNEVKGLPPAILKLADRTIEIPMRGKMVRQARHPRHTGEGKESLNVAVAFGIAAFAIMDKE